VGISGKSGYPIRFGEFLRYGALVTAVSIAVSGIYLWLRYFVLA
jgi:Na+/H+ antiporter NhaD/arsenite permease-like protein